MIVSVQESTEDLSQPKYHAGLRVKYRSTDKTITQKFSCDQDGKCVIGGPRICQNWLTFTDKKYTIPNIPGTCNLITTLGRRRKIGKYVMLKPLEEMMKSKEHDATNLWWWEWNAV